MTISQIENIFVRRLLTIFATILSFVYMILYVLISELINALVGVLRHLFFGFSKSIQRI